MPPSADCHSNAARLQVTWWHVNEHAALSAHETTIAAHPHLHIFCANIKLISGRNKQMGEIKAQKLTAGAERATHSRAHTPAGQKEGTTGSLALLL